MTNAASCSQLSAQQKSEQHMCRECQAPSPPSLCHRCCDRMGVPYEGEGPLDRVMREGREAAFNKWRRGEMDANRVNDVVNHPGHYTQGGIECIDALEAATVGKSGIEAVCTANVIKYLWRYERKNGAEDVKKARWYLERLLRELES